MTAPDIAFIVALLLAAIDEVTAKGRSTTHWAIIFICIGLLWHLAPWA